MKWLVLALCVYAMPAWAAAPDGRQIFLHGNNNGAMPCAACHGRNGEGNASIGAPKLAGLPASTVETALALFANGQGGNATMQFIAQALSPAETRSLATYLSSLAPASPPAGPTSPPARD